MKVRITSSFTNESWEDTLDLTGEEPPTIDELFTFFQRVTKQDSDRLLALGYTLPSISAGDRIEIDGVAWKVEAIGFSLDERDPNEPLRPWPMGKDD